MLIDGGGSVNEPSIPDILQLLINGGGSVNKSSSYTPLVALVRWNNGDAAARLQVLLADPDLDLDAKYGWKTAEEWAEFGGCSVLAVAIAEERSKRERWSVLRAAWITATATPSVCKYK
jgi:hypothetical protein